MKKIIRWIDDIKEAMGRRAEEAETGEPVARRRAWERETAAFVRRLKTEPRTVEELERYLERVCHARQLPGGTGRCEKMRNEMRTALICFYAGQLLPKPARYPADQNDAVKLKRYFDYMARREERARAVTDEEFPTDFSFYEIGVRVEEKPSRAERLYCLAVSRFTGRYREPERKTSGAVVRIGVERQRGIIRGEAAGSGPALKKASRLVCDIYEYYGVSKEDVKDKSLRFKELHYAVRQYGRGSRGGVALQEY